MQATFGLAVVVSERRGRGHRNGMARRLTLWRYVLFRSFGLKAPRISLQQGAEMAQERIACTALAMIVALTIAAACASAVPIIDGEIDSVECKDALLFANAVFNSRDSRLFGPSSVPDSLGSELVFGARGAGYYGIYGLIFDEAIFEKLEAEYHTTYRQRMPSNGVRMIIEYVNFRDGAYVARLNGEVSSSEDSHEPDDDCCSYEAMSWSPPLIFRHKTIGTFWAIDVGQPYNVMGDWRIFTPARNGYTQSCAVQFTEDPENVHKQLPYSVTTLMALLDKTLGDPGFMEEGTGGFTPRLRLHAKHIWANAALRPWAISDGDRYNSKEEVDAGLAEWAKYGPDNMKIYRQISEIFPKAAKELAVYYEDRFGLDANGAHELASWIAKIGYSANFRFSKSDNDFDRYGSVDTNPWEKVRPTEDSLLQ